MKDVIAHIASGEHELVPVLRTHVLAGDLWNLSDDERNEIEYQQHKDRPLHDIVNEERQAYTALLEVGEQLLGTRICNDPHCFKTMPAEWRPWQLIAGDFFEALRGPYAFSA